MTTPEQAREIAQHLFFPNGDNGYALRSLAEQVETLTAERDEWKARCEFSFEQRDKLTAERDALKSSERGLNRYAAKVNSENTALTAERDALTTKVASFESRIDQHVKTELALIVNNKSLKDAARLALDASQKFVNKVDAGLARSKESYEDLKQVIAALKAVL